MDIAKSQRKDVHGMKSTDIAWLAGLLEGEGTFGIQKTGGYKGTIKIGLQMTDKDTVEKASDLLGGTLWGPHGPYGVSKQVTYQTSIFGTKAASWMMTVYSLMGERRQEKIRSLLTMWKSQPVMRAGRAATCHPDMPRSAKGLCSSCYMKKYHKERQNSHSFA